MNYLVSTGGEVQNGIPNQRMIDYWTPENTGAEWQKPVYTGTGVGVTPTKSDRFQESIIHHPGIFAGYYLPEKICKPLGISNRKLFTQPATGNALLSVDFLDLTWYLHTTTEDHCWRRDRI